MCIRDRWYQRRVRGFRLAPSPQAQLRATHPTMTPRGTIANTLAQARASLLEPSRPFTPADSANSRSLFKGSDYAHRPATADCYDINMRPDTSYTREPLSNQGENSMGQATHNEFMWSTTEGGTVYDLEAESAQEQFPAPPARPLSSSRISMDCSAVAKPSPPPKAKCSAPASQSPRQSNKNISDPTPRQPTKVKKPSELPEWLEAALEKLDGSNQLDTRLSGCDTILDFLLEHQDVEFRTAQPSMSRAIQRKVFKLMDAKEPAVLAKLGTIALNVTSKQENICSVCKLLFRLSKDEANDTVVGEPSLLRTVLGLSEGHELSYECLIFIGGVFKNAALSGTNRRRLINLGLIQKLGRLLAAVQKGYKQQPADSLGQLLVQITGCLRNMCAGDALADAQQQFVEFNLFHYLAWVLERFSRHEELVLNIVRALHKLTLNASCRQSLAQAPMMVGQLLHTLVPHANNIPIVVRVGFVLGNLTASEVSSRTELAAGGGVDLLVGLLEQYNQRDLELCSSPSPSPSEDNPEATAARTKQLSESADVLTKLVRLLANLAIDPKVGPTVSCHPNMKALISILDRRFISSSEELVLNTVSAVTNLSFYEDSCNVLMQHREVLLDRIKPLLLHPNDEAVVESVRALGNLSREQEARDLMCQLQIDQVLVMLLDHANSEVLYSVCGVLTNIAADPRHKNALAKMDGVSRMIKLIGRSCSSEIPLAVIACRALFNFCLENAGEAVSYTHLRAHETPEHLVCRLLLEKKKKKKKLQPTHLQQK
eukprot:TRINITY_DN15531_c0_g1_i19.p1 TRINITY_DN15531_c0_g1~~TRINITY_DN15531_c0_g1_i19.p1  ORF type:complete len:771 (-),score=188.37 TRINITY_DN15531_c0_g1_i19:75-2387(-)